MSEFADRQVGSTEIKEVKKVIPVEKVHMHATFETSPICVLLIAQFVACIGPLSRTSIK